MPTIRRAGRRRARVQAERAGEEIANARATHGWTRAEVSRRAGVSADTERRVESGDPAVQLDTLCAINEVVGLDLVIRMYPARQPSLRDTGQLALAERLVALADPAWTSALEVPAGDRGEAADVAFYGATEILHMEIERLVTDFQDRYRRCAAKRDWIAARHQRPVRLVMAIQDTARNRHALAPHLDFIRSVLPSGSRETLGALRSGRPLGRDGLVWLRRRR